MTALFLGRLDVKGPAIGQPQNIRVRSLKYVPIRRYLGFVTDGRFLRTLEQQDYLMLEAVRNVNTKTSIATLKF